MHLPVYWVAAYKVDSSRFLASGVYRFLAGSEHPQRDISKAVRAQPISTPQTTQATSHATDIYIFRDLVRHYIHSEEAYEHGTACTHSFSTLSRICCNTHKHGTALVLCLFIISKADTKLDRPVEAVPTCPHIHNVDHRRAPVVLPHSLVNIHNRSRTTSAVLVVWA